MSKPNVLVIVVDGLAQQGIALDGPRSGLIPTIRKLAGSGYMATNCFAHGAPTEFAFPSLMTSTLPLDHGGYQVTYDRRPISFLKAARQVEYATGLFSGAFIVDRLYGIDDGADYLRSMYAIDSAFRYLRRGYIFHIAEAYRHTKDRGVYIRDAVHAFNLFLPFLQDLAARLERDRLDAPTAPTRIYNYPFKDIADRLATEIAALRQDPEAYACRNVDRVLNHDLYEYLGLRSFRKRFEAILSALDGLRFPGTSAALKGYEKNASGAHILAAAFNWIDAQTRQPVAALIHLMDVHDDLYSDNCYLQTVSGPVKRRVRSMNDAGIPVRPEDLALAYTDSCLEGFFRKLDAAGRLRDTIVILTSDHGVQSYKGETCLSSTTPPGSFKDIYLSVPMIITGPGVETKVDTRLQQSLDLAPTVCDLIGAPTPAGYRGQSIFASDNRVEQVISEHMHRGPCDIEGKPIYMSIRSATHKYIWKEGFAGHDRSPLKHEQLFDLDNDPDESTDRSEDPALRERLERFRHIRAARVAEIRMEQSAQTAGADRS